SERLAPQPSSRPMWGMLLPRALAAAILLAFGVWVGQRSVRPMAPSPQLPGPDAISVPVLPAAVVSQAEEVHGFCSRLAEGLHTAGYPADVAPLAASVEHDLQSNHPYPDLGAI